MTATIAIAIVIAKQYFSAYKGLRSVLGGPVQHSVEHMAGLIGI